jgi:hypothetical protein
MLSDGDTRCFHMNLITFPQAGSRSPVLPEKRYKNKAKGDMLSKGLVILQAGWFVTHIAARRAHISHGTNPLARLFPRHHLSRCGCNATAPTVWLEQIFW